MSCDCDDDRCPPPWAIAAGLARLPRAPGLFADWRRHLLAAVGRETALVEWRAREPGDLGLMLIEMGAYVLDVTSFYDQLVANESYLPTARLVGAQRRHVGLLGYLPRPAIGSSVWLAAEADGTRLVKLPAGTALRSGAFDGNPPQVFELEADAMLEPRVNRLAVDRVRATYLPTLLASITVAGSSMRTRAGDVVVLAAASSLAVTRVATTSPLQLRTRDAATRIAFTGNVSVPSGATYAGTRLLKGASTCGAWKLAPASGEPAVLSGSDLSLETRVALQPGDIVAFDDGADLSVRRVVSTSIAQYTILGAQTSTITDAAKNVSTLLSPPIKVGVTRVTFDAAPSFSAASLAKLVVHYAMSDAATLFAPWQDTLKQGDPIVLPDLVDPPRIGITELMLEDVHGDGVVTTGLVDAASHSASTSGAPAWGLDLWAPVQLSGNVLLATRGESVHGELLGSGDASQPTQTFRLKKKPLTYLSASNAAGRRSTLVVHVAGVQWQEVETFYGTRAEQSVFTVRHDEAGNTDLQFGGAARLPTGAAVVADYRFGAGAALPPADSVKQVARPVAGLRKVRNGLAAFGGADAERAAELALRGPASALLLGRAISLVDIETAAAQQPGVRAARAAWRWDATGLRPAVIVSYIGDAQLAPSIQATLRDLAEDDAPITAKSASAQPTWLEADIEIDPRDVPSDVIAAVISVLFAAVTLPGSGGLLRPERLGPDGVVFMSVVVRAIVDVAGVAALRSLAFNGNPFIDIGRTPAAGAYFDFAAGGIWVNGQRAPA